MSGRRSRVCATVTPVLYEGTPRRAGETSIEAPDPTVIRGAACDDDVSSERSEWLAVGEARSDSLYFSIVESGRLVGQIFLHDRDDSCGETLIGYHLFLAPDRGRGIGTAALGLLRDWCFENTTPKRLVAITSEDNLASRGAAENAGFVYVGRPREDKERGHVYEFRRPA